MSDVPVTDVPGDAGDRVDRRLRRPPTRLAAMAALVLAIGASACTGADALPSASDPSAQTRPAGSFTVPPDDQRAIRATVDRVNATAGGPVAGQQKVLADVVDPGSAAVLSRCPPTTSTLRFDPVYDGLRPTPGWRPTSGALSGAVYALPALIRIYTGDRITGTDLTTLHFGVHDGEAWITPLCVS